VFLCNGIRWFRVRYALEKVMFNNKNTARCLEYFDKSFMSTFIDSLISNGTLENVDLGHRVKLLMVQTMFSVMFGSELEVFLADANKSLADGSSLKQTHLVANKFSDAFVDFESFSLLKFFAMMMPELKMIWTSLNNFKQFFNTYMLSLSYFSDPMDWFYKNFISKNLLIYIKNAKNQNGLSRREPLFSVEEYPVEDFGKASQNFHSSTSTRTSRSQMQKLNAKPFCYFDSFLFLTKNPIIKYNQSEMSNRKMSTLKPMPSVIKKAFTKTKNLSCSSYSQIMNNKETMKKNKERRRSFNDPLNDLNEEISANFWIDNENKSSRLKKTRGNLNSTSDFQMGDDFENWKLTLNEALSNTLLMFFAGYETTSSAISFCCKILTTMPEQREKLLEEIKENLNELEHLINKTSSLNKNENSKKSNFSESEDESSNDDVFEDSSPKETKANIDEIPDKWNDLYDTIEKLSYLDMFVREVLRMFPIANSMVSRKCAIDNFKIGNGNYSIPKGMNVVVDVLTIHYSPVLWGPRDPEEFYPEVGIILKLIKHF
jgi:hypothetical protein